ncbi:hypothetical protein D3C72_212430 [compost metagenome]
MSASFLSAIDWSSPWLANVRTLGQGLAQADDWQQELNRRATALGLRNHRDLPLRFVPQAELPADTAYEAHISQTGHVPTRDNLHDFFNALVWLTFPRIKVQLNLLQAREIARAAAGQALAPRGKLRDAATIFDENAVLLISANHDLMHALREHEWESVFVQRRAEFVADCRVYLFGHALMEKLVQPYKAITGHTWIVAQACPPSELPLAEQCAWVDQTVAQQLAQGLSTADFSPLQMLGVPGWWPDQDANFYRDATVFRPKRKA